MVEDNDQSYGRNANKSVLLKIVILGDGGVGKSCLMSRFISNHFDDHNFHTIGVEFMNKMIEVGGKQYTLQVKHFCHKILLARSCVVCTLCCVKRS